MDLLSFYEQLLNGDASRITILFSVVMIIGYWKVFVKAGEAGWKALIPVYSVYILYKVSGKVDLFVQSIVSMVLMFVSLFLAITGMYMDSGAMVLIFFLLLIVVSIWQIVIRYKQCKALATRFNQPTSFAVGLFLLEGIFLLILGFGHQYQYNSYEE